MKSIFTILVFLILPVVHAQTDTLNRIDADGKKYGYWIIYGKDRPKSGFADTSIVEEGKYVSGKKTGLWKTYYANGIKKSEIEYKNNRPNGKFITYYENGQIQEAGTWKGTFYVGKFIRYLSNGCKVQEKDFGLNGKSVSYIYYSSKCDVRSEEMFKLDSIKSVYIYYDSVGVINKSDTILNQAAGPYDHHVDYKKEFSRPGLLHDQNSSTEFKHLVIRSNSISKYYDYDCKCYKNLTETDNGYKKLYNENKQISEDGDFKNGKLYNGKKYIYDKNGLLDAIEIYKNGKYAGDAQID